MHRIGLKLGQTPFPHVTNLQVSWQLKFWKKVDSGIWTHDLQYGTWAKMAKIDPIRNRHTRMVSIDFGAVSVWGTSETYTGEFLAPDDTREGTRFLPLLPQTLNPKKHK